MRARTHTHTHTYTHTYAHTHTRTHANLSRARKHTATASEQVVWSGQEAVEEEGLWMLLSEGSVATAFVAILLFSCLRDTYRFVLYVECSGADVPTVSLSHSPTHTHAHT